MDAHGIGGSGAVGMQRFAGVVEAMAMGLTIAIIGGCRAVEVPAGCIALPSSDGGTRALHVKSGIVLRLLPAWEPSSPQGKPEPGNHDEPEDERGWTSESADVEAVWFSETEVSVGQWQRFIDATGYVTDPESKGTRSTKRRGARTYHPESGEWRVGPCSWRDPLPNVPEFTNGPTMPVVCISWQDAQQFCRWAGLNMPTERQWDLACIAGRASTTGIAETRDEVSEARASPLTAASDGPMQWMAPVGTTVPDACGLYDLDGNVAEWCRDVFVPEDRPKGFRTRRAPYGMVVRGGDYSVSPAACEERGWESPDFGNARVGFRVVLEVKSSK